MSSGNGFAHDTAAIGMITININLIYLAILDTIIRLISAKPVPKGLPGD
jgi:hypothetical protein